MESKLQSFIRGFFWSGFIVFLSASIPHLATYFRHFEPSASGAGDVWYWTISYAIAVVIDTSDVLVSITLSQAHNKGLTIKDTWALWLFILFIMSLSWLINWQYDKTFADTAFASVDNLKLPIFGITMHSLNPVIGSSFSVLIFVYTKMAQRFSKEESIEDVRAKIKKLEEEKNDREKLRQLSAKTDEKIDVIGAAFSVVNRVKTELKKEPKTDEKIPEKTTVYLPENMAVNTEPNISFLEQDTAPSMRILPQFAFSSDDPIIDELEPYANAPVEQDEPIERKEIETDERGNNASPDEYDKNDIESAYQAGSYASSPSVRGASGYSLDEISELEPLKSLYKRSGTRQRAIEAAVTQGLLKRMKSNNRITKNSVENWLKTMPVEV